MSKFETCSQAVKFAVGKARHAGELSIPSRFGVRRDTGEGSKSGRWSVMVRMGAAQNQIMSGIWCSGRNSDGSYDVEIREGLTYRV